MLTVALLALIQLVVFQGKVEVLPRLVAGDEFRLEVTRVREDSARPLASYTGRTPVDVRVISAGPAGFVLDWRPRATVFEQGKAPSDPTIVATGQAVSELGFRIALNADGEYMRLENEAEVTSKLEAVRDAVVKSTLVGLPPADRKRMEDGLRQVLSTANMIAIATRDAQIYVGGNGLALAVGDTLEATVQQPSPLGGTVPAVYRARMESATAETASISTTTAYDADALMKTVAAFLEKSGGKPAPPAEVAKIKLEMNDDGKYLFDRQFGLMREVTITRVQSLAGTRRLDRWVIRLVAAPKRAAGPHDR